MLDIKGLELLQKVYDENPPPIKDTKILGMTISKQMDLLGGMDYFLTLPDPPKQWQKVLAFVLLKIHLINFARRENDYGDYAFNCNAENIFKRDWGSKKVL